jgi:protein TonB
MNANCLIPEPDRQAWRRSLPFFLIAIALHAAVLLFPLKFASGDLEIPPPGIVNVRLVEPPTVSAPVIPEAQPAQAPSSPKRERTLATARPKLAMAPEQASAPAAFSVPLPTPVAVAPATQVAPSAVQAAPSFVGARFDAAYLHNPHPSYPPLSRRLGEEGKVLLRVRVSADGQPAAVDLEKSSNFERLDEAARQVVARWRFVPAKRGDEAVEATVIVPIVFRLDD